MKRFASSPYLLLLLLVIISLWLPACVPHRQGHGWRDDGYRSGSNYNYAPAARPIIVNNHSPVYSRPAHISPKPVYNPGRERDKNKGRPSYSRPSHNNGKPDKPAYVGKPSGNYTNPNYSQNRPSGNHSRPGYGQYRPGKENNKVSDGRRPSGERPKPSGERNRPSGDRYNPSNDGYKSRPSFNQSNARPDRQRPNQSGGGSSQRDSKRNWRN